MDTIVLYLGIPSVTKVSCDNLWAPREPYSDETTSSTQLATSNMKDLSLPQSGLPMNLVRPFFGLFPKLESLSFRVGPLAVENRDKFDPERFSDAIAHLEESLVALSVTSLWDPDQEEIRVLKPFSGFKNLRRLETSKSCIVQL